MTVVAKLTSVTTDWAKYPGVMLRCVAMESVLEKQLGEEFTHTLREIREAWCRAEGCAGHEWPEGGSSDGGSGTTEPDGHPED